MEKSVTIHSVLDWGEVELLQACGDDLTPVGAARTSFAGRVGDEERDVKLLRYLAENGHHGPFEFIDATWRVKAPIFVARQWMRHRTGSYNEFSYRYADPKKLSDGEAAQYYAPRQWKAQGTGNKQTSGSELPGTGMDIEVAYHDSMREARQSYNDAIEHGVSREQARLFLPTSFYTQFWYKTNMRNLLHFLTLRLDEHAQEETRMFAEAIAKDVESNWPLVWGLFKEGHFA